MDTLFADSRFACNIYFEILVRGLLLDMFGENDLRWEYK